MFLLFPHSFSSRDRTWAAYKILLYLAPQLKKVLEDPDPSSLNTYLSLVSFSSQSFFYCLLNSYCSSFRKGPMALVVMMSNVSRKSLGLGLTSITNPSGSLIRRLEKVGGSNTMSVVDYLLQSSLIGKT